MEINWIDFIEVGVTATCLCIGFILKNAVPTEKINRFIPLIMGVLGIVLNMWGNAWVFTPNVLLVGIVSGLASTGAYELVRNLRK